MSEKLQSLIVSKGLTILDILIDSRYQKKYICQCPTINCQKTMIINRERDLNKKCRTCANRTPIDEKKILNWQILTTNYLEAVTPLAKANPDLFIREEIVIEPGRYADGKKRVILKCPTPSCIGIISVYDIHKTDVNKLTFSTCRLCADISRRKRPYELIYNRAIKQIKRKSEARVKNIKWLLSYDEFATLCAIPNCHYCNKSLNRAKHKADGGTLATQLDRKDSSKDYTLDNCVPCCPDCNFTKNERISYDEMVLIMKHRKLWVEKREI
jgi:hypothetical protein